MNERTFQGYKNGDILSNDEIRKILAENRCEAIYHGKSAPLEFFSEEEGPDEFGLSGWEAFLFLSCDSQEWGGDKEVVCFRCLDEDCSIMVV